ncbi:hypothetical protein [Bittarella sp. HCP28S3_D9]|uniref:hypothetical protein n=1 Tax=Bittarella sp. HCP28S3_D9 TaxID=3440253 RepID=UPI003F8A6BD5
MNEYPQVTYINNQDDWYEFLLFEQYWSCLDDRKNAANVLMKCLIADLLFTIFFVFAPFIDKAYIWLTLAFAAVFVLRFFYEYYSGYIADYRNMTNLYLNLKKSNIVNIYDDKIFLSFGESEVNLAADNYRRFFEYEDIAYIQETSNLIIIRIKENTNKPNLRQFQRVIISKRYIFPDKVEKLRAFLGEKIEEYHIPKLLTEEEMEGLHLATEDRSAR